MEMIVCKLCNIEYKLDGFSNHIFNSHVRKNDISSIIEYYHKFISEVIPTCENCNGTVKFISIKHGYQRHCSHKCSCENPIVRKNKVDMTKKSIFEKYGVDNPSKIHGHGDKTKKTKFEKYGDSNYNNSKKSVHTNIKNHGGVFSTATDDYKEKYKKTSMEKYGVIHHTKSDIIKEKSKNTNIIKYSVEYPMQSDMIKSKMIKTNNDRYGGILHGSPIISEKIKKSLIEKYGTDVPLRNDDILDKMKRTNLIKYDGEYTLQNKNILMKLYGVDNINKLDWVQEKQKKNRKETIKNRYHVENISQLKEIQDMIKNHNMEKYGVENTTQLEEIKEKMKNTCFEKYGVYNVMHDTDIRQKCHSSNNRDKYKLQKYILPNGNAISYQSKMELKYIINCIENDIYIENGDKIPYYSNDGKLHYYFCDFKIKENNLYRLIEIKGKTKWFFESIENGALLLKVIAAQKWSLDNGYLPYKMEINYGYNKNKRI